MIAKNAVLTPQLAQAYVDVIGLLFDGVIKATPDQITHQVMVNVDTMMVEIAKCSKATSHLGFEFIYELLLTKAPENIVGRVIENLYIRYKTEEIIKDKISEWVLKLVENIRYKTCLDSARVNWRSKIEMDVLDI